MKMYRHLQTDIAELLRQARGLAIRSVNAVMTASYWKVGRRIVEAEQIGIPPIQSTFNNVKTALEWKK